MHFFLSIYNHIIGKARFYILLIIFVASILTLSFEHTLWTILFLATNCFFLQFIRRKIINVKEFRFITTVCIIGFTLRFIIVLITTVYPFLTVSSDAVTYETKAMEIVNEWKHGKMLAGAFSQHFLYYIYNAAVYYLIGFYPSVIRILNCLYGILAALNLYFAGRRMFGEAAARITLLLAVFFPSIIFWQTMNLKEAFVTLFLTIIINYITIMKFKPDLKTLSVILLFSLLLILTRSYLGIFIAALSFLYFLALCKYSLRVKVIIFCIMACIIGAVTYKTGMGLFGVNLLKNFDLEYIDKVRKTSYKGGSEILQNINMNTPISLIKYLPLAILYFLFSPFPWQISGSIMQVMGALLNIIWYPLFIVFTIGAISSYKKERLFSLFLFTVIIFCTLFYSMSLGNMGLAFRFRDMLMPAFFIFSSVGITKISEMFIQKRKGNGKLQCQNF